MPSWLYYRLPCPTHSTHYVRTLLYPVPSLSLRSSLMVPPQSFLYIWQPEASIQGGDPASVNHLMLNTTKIEVHSVDFMSLTGHVNPKRCWNVLKLVNMCKLWPALFCITLGPKISNFLHFYFNNRISLGRGPFCSQWHAGLWPVPYLCGGLLEWRGLLSPTGWLHQLVPPPQPRLSLWTWGPWRHQWTVWLWLWRPDTRFKERRDGGLAFSTEDLSVFSVTQNSRFADILLVLWGAFSFLFFFFFYNFSYLNSTAMSLKALLPLELCGTWLALLFGHWNVLDQY